MDSGNEADLTVNSFKGRVVGRVSGDDGRVFLVEEDGDGHAWIEVEVNQNEDEDDAVEVVSQSGGRGIS